jgi:hypothetical protein
VRLSPVEQNPPRQASRRRSRGGGSGGGRWACGCGFALVPRTETLRLQPLPSPCWSRPSAAPAAAIASDAAADPSAPLRSFLAPLHSRAGSFRSGVAGRAAPRSAPSAIVFRGAHPRLRFSVYRGGWRRFGSSIRNRRSRQEVSSLRSIRSGEAYGLAECCGWLVPRHAPPRTPLRSALHTLPALRPPQAAAALEGMRFGNVFREVGAY